MFLNNSLISFFPYYSWKSIFHIPLVRLLFLIFFSYNDVLKFLSNQTFAYKCICKASSMWYTNFLRPLECDPRISIRIFDANEAVKSFSESKLVQFAYRDRVQREYVRACVFWCECACEKRGRHGVCRRKKKFILKVNETRKKSLSRAPFIK